MYGKESSHADVPIQYKVLLTFPQLAQYTGIGENKLRELAEREENADWILKNGNRKLIKRELFQQFLLELDEI